MTEEQFKNLKRGDIVIGKVTGDSYVVDRPLGGDKCVTVVRTLIISQSDEWELFNKKLED